MFQFVAPKHKTPINLLTNHMRLLTLIGHLGFVTDQQLDMLWSVCVHYPTTFTRSILREWCSYGGILKKHEKSPSSKKSGILYTAYSLTDNGKAFILKHAYLSAEELAVDTVSVNSHNLQAIEVVVQGLYAASFKHHTLGTDTIAYTSPFNKQTITLANPYLNTAINFSSGGEEGPDGAGPSSCRTPLGAVPHGVVDMLMRRKKEEPGGQESQRLAKGKQQYMACVPVSLLKAVNEIVTATVNPVASPAEASRITTEDNLNDGPVASIPNAYLAMVPTLTNQLSSWLVTGLVDIKMVAMVNPVDSQMVIQQQVLRSFIKRLTDYQTGTQGVLQWVAIRHLLTMGTLVAGSMTQSGSVGNMDTGGQEPVPSTAMPADSKGQPGNAGVAKRHPRATSFGSKLPALKQAGQPSTGHSIGKTDATPTPQASGNSNNVNPLGWSGPVVDAFDELGLVPESPTEDQTTDQVVTAQAAANSDLLDPSALMASSNLTDSVVTTGNNFSNPIHDLPDAATKAKDATHGPQEPLESAPATTRTASARSLPVKAPAASDPTKAASDLTTNDATTNNQAKNNPVATQLTPNQAPSVRMTRTANRPANQSQAGELAREQTDRQVGAAGNPGVANRPTNDTNLPVDGNTADTTQRHPTDATQVTIGDAIQGTPNDFNRHPVMTPAPPMVSDTLGPLPFNDVGWLPILQTSVTNQITMVGWWRRGVAIRHPKSDHNGNPSATQNGADLDSHGVAAGTLGLTDPLAGSLSNVAPNGLQTASQEHLGHSGVLDNPVGTTAGQHSSSYEAIKAADHQGGLLPLGSLRDLQAGTVWVANWLPTSYHLATNSVTHDGTTLATRNRTTKATHHDPHNARDIREKPDVPDAQNAYDTSKQHKHTAHKNALTGDVGHSGGTDRYGDVGRTGDAKGTSTDPSNSSFSSTGRVAPTALPDCVLQQLLQASLVTILALQKSALPSAQKPTLSSAPAPDKAMTSAAMITGDVNHNAPLTASGTSPRKTGIFNRDALTGGAGQTSGDELGTLSERPSRRSADAATYLASTAWDEIRLAKPPVQTTFASGGTHDQTAPGDAIKSMAKHSTNRSGRYSGDSRDGANGEENGTSGRHPSNIKQSASSHSLNRFTLFGQRPTDLISNPTFHLEDYNLASFSHQFKVRNPQLYQATHRLTVNDRGEFVRQAIDPDTSTADFPFVADEMISFKRAGRPHELFVELDNRTEGNATQIQKVLNYIWYALEHPEKEIMMVLAIADGSVPTKQISQYGNIGRKLGNLATRLFRAYVPNTHHTHSQQANLNGDDGHEEMVYLTDLYQQATNLSVRLTGVGEAHLDVAEFLLGSDYFLDYVSSVSRLVAHYNNRANDWQARFEPSAQYRSYVSQLPTRYGLQYHPSGTHLVNQKTRHNDPSKDHNSSSNGWPNSVFADPTLRNPPGDAASVIPQGTNQNTFGDEKCHPNSTQQHPLVHDTFDRWGTLVLTRQQSDYQRTQPILFGHEHSLDTLWHQYQLSTAPPALGLPTIPPITIYPHRERSVTAISLPEYRTMFNYPTTHAFQTPLLIQPYWGLTQNLQLQQELRWLIYQYQRDIIKYFQTGELNPSSSALAALPFNYLPCFNPLFGDGNAQASFFTGYGQSFNHRGWVSDGVVTGDGIYVDPLNTPPLSTIFAPMRSWHELHALLQVLSPAAFINQLRLDEVPLRLFQQLLHRWPKTAFSQPVIQPLAHWLSPNVVNHMDQLLQFPSLSLTYPSNLLPDSRLRPKI
ncbi:hypothetical protein FC43_GL001776 [Limosilactobacillus ingluviei DSM 15946]|uniref:Uncharacterized protein n=2 Tax=Limosilactobacillus ingluviei TaxID=148604 RepID=A0A0R1U7T0_9LACO|nr:hypothetical protein FC43_GL001776 [Limosilactobacillus ingluviei DSM 15946]